MAYGRASFIAVFVSYGFLLARLGCAEGAAKPDLIVVNANVITVNDAIPRAEAFAVQDGNIAAVGKSSDIRQLSSENTQVLDLAGKTVVPGFIDAHLHPSPVYPFTSLQAAVDLTPNSVKTMDELIDLLKKKAAITPKGQWIRGSRYQDTKLGRHPTRWDLDKASTDHPISISHSSGHVSVVNSLALKLSGITKEAQDPPGGAFDRDASGEPNGVCREGAGSVVRRGGPKLPDPTPEEYKEGIRLCYLNYMSKGLTSVGLAGTSLERFKQYQTEFADVVPVRVSIMIREDNLDELKQAGIGRGYGDNHFRVGPIKLFHGNSLSGRTCWLYEPYDMINPKTGKRDYYGIPPKRSQEDLNALILRIHEAGYQAAVHSNGDREIDMVLNAFENALQKSPRENHRHRIEHCSVVNEQILKRIKALGVVVVPHSYIYEHGDKMEEFGAQRWGMMHPNRSTVEMGIPVAGHSDSSVSAADPMLRIQSMVTRMSAEGKVYGAEQRLTVEQALRIWTIGGAYATFEEDIKGSIEAGKLADFVILSADPTKVPANTLKDVEIEKTFIGGKLVYEKSG